MPQASRAVQENKLYYSGAFAIPFGQFGSSPPQALASPADLPGMVDPSPGILAAAAYRAAARRLDEQLAGFNPSHRAESPPVLSHRAKPPPVLNHPAGRPPLLSLAAQPVMPGRPTIAVMVACMTANGR